MSLTSAPPLSAIFAPRPRARLLTGLVLALLLGFGAANLYAAFAESRYAEIRRTGEVDTAPVTQEDYDRAIQVRSTAVSALHSARNRIAISASLVWLAVGAAAAYVFFKLLA